MQKPQQFLLEPSAHLDAAVRILLSWRSYRERVAYGFHKQRPYMQTNELHVLFVPSHTCASDSLDGEARRQLQKGPLEVDNDI